MEEINKKKKLEDLHPKAAEIVKMLGLQFLDSMTKEEFLEKEEIFKELQPYIDEAVMQTGYYTRKTMYTKNNGLFLGTKVSDPVLEALIALKNELDVYGEIEEFNYYSEDNLFNPAVVKAFVKDVSYEAGQVAPAYLYSEKFFEESNAFMSDLIWYMVDLVEDDVEEGVWKTFRDFKNHLNHNFPSFQSEEYHHGFPRFVKALKNQTIKFLIAARITKLFEETKVEDGIIDIWGHQIFAYFPNQTLDEEGLDLMVRELLEDSDIEPGYILLTFLGGGYIDE